jgi:hypothetical protein
MSFDPRSFRDLLDLLWPLDASSSCQTTLLTALAYEPSSPETRSSRWDARVECIFLDLRKACRPDDWSNPQLFFVASCAVYEETIRQLQEASIRDETARKVRHLRPLSDPSQSYQALERLPVYGPVFTHDPVQVAHVRRTCPDNSHVIRPVNLIARSMMPGLYIGCPNCQHNGTNNDVEMVLQQART